MNGQQELPTGGTQEIDLLGYLPPFLAAYRELAAGLRAEEPEFRLAWLGAGRVLGNQFVLTADAAGLARFEALLHILPGAGDTLEARRARILAALTRHPPYTLPWLRGWLDGLCGAGGHWEKVTDYTFTLGFDGDALGRAHLAAWEIVRMLYPILPVNLDWHVEMTLEMRSTLHLGGCVFAAPQFGVGEKPDNLARESTVYAGGGVGAQTARGVPENPGPPRRATIVRAGGVYTILTRRA